MSNTEMNRAVVPAASVHSYAFNLYRLESEIRADDPDMNGVVELLDSLRSLQGVGRFGIIGDEAEHCLEYFVQQKVDSPDQVDDIELSRQEQAEIAKKTRQWIGRFEHLLESTVAAAPTTEMPPNELLGGSHELLAEQVGERFEAPVRDLNEAASNLCAGSYTSAEFMCIRSVERILREFFRDRMGPAASRDWSRALDVVVEEKGGDLPGELQILEYLRDRRQEIVRPENHSSRQDAEQTLMKTFKLVDALVEQL